MNTASKGNNGAEVEVHLAITLLDALYGLADNNNDSHCKPLGGLRYIEDHVSAEVAPYESGTNDLKQRTDALSFVDTKMPGFLKTWKSNQMSFYLLLIPEEWRRQF
ncbi:MAG: hypothetical protein IPM34_13240 [Saprospiraceae bacterium]|nr:hypothetical protein [Saprospiraceae bacterium]